MLIPVKSFALAKVRLAGVLSGPERSTLARGMAERVVAAAGTLPVWCVCDDPEVRTWAASVGADVEWTPGLGLNGAVQAAVQRRNQAGTGRVVVAHGDLPFAAGLDAFAAAAPDEVVIVPDRRASGSNVVSVPTGAGFRFAYGVDSVRPALRRGHPVRPVGARGPRRGTGLGCGRAGRPGGPHPPGSAAGGDAVSDPTGAAPSRDLPTPERALVVVAHPDDAEFQAGATLAKWARAGCVVHHLVMTDGSKGTWDRTVDSEWLVRQRKDEQRAAATLLGGSGVVFLDHVDGELDADRTTRAQVCSVIRRLRPTVVLGHDPWKRYRLHPDHRAAGQLCVDGIVAARDPFFHSEQLVDGLTPHRPDALLLFEADEVNHHEVVTEEDLTAKLAALEAHVTQMETTHFYKVGDGDPLEEFRAGQRSRLATAGLAAGAPLAEAYHVIIDQL